MRVKNMPGGGGVVGMNYVYNANPDGLTLINTEAGSGLLAPALLSDPGVEYDVTKLRYFGTVARTPGALAVSIKASL